jgi:hypothetical protein
MTGKITDKGHLEANFFDNEEMMQYNYRLSLM